MELFASTEAQQPERPILAGDYSQCSRSTPARCLTLNASQRWQITSQYFRFSSSPPPARAAFSRVINVVPLPPNGSKNVPRFLLLFRNALSTSAEKGQQVIALGRLGSSLRRSRESGA